MQALPISSFNIQLDKNARIEDHAQMKKTVQQALIKGCNTIEANIR